MPKETDPPHRLPRPPENGASAPSTAALTQSDPQPRAREPALVSLPRPTPPHPNHSSPGAERSAPRHTIQEPAANGASAARAGGAPCLRHPRMPTTRPARNANPSSPRCRVWGGTGPGRGGTPGGRLFIPPRTAPYLRYPRIRRAAHSAKLARRYCPVSRSSSIGAFAFMGIVRTRSNSFSGLTTTTSPK